MTKLTKEQLDRASEIAMKGFDEKFKTMSSGQIQALRGMANTFKPLLGKEEAKEFVKKVKKKK